MGIGGIILDGEEPVVSFSDAIGRGTNNIAEWRALIRGLELAHERGIRSIACEMDSELVVSQFNDRCDTKHTNLILLRDEALSMKGKFDSVAVSWIPRHLNADADALASLAVGMPQAPIVQGRAVPWERTSPANCPEALRAFNASEPNFEDFISLRVGGIDAFSRLKGQPLLEAVLAQWREADLDWMLAALGQYADTPFGKSVLRWVARGLEPPLALKKAAVDEERGAARKRQAKATDV